jgi:hypothetical protein
MLTVCWQLSAGNVDGVETDTAACRAAAAAATAAREPGTQRWAAAAMSCSYLLAVQLRGHSRRQTWSAVWLLVKTSFRLMQLANECRHGLHAGDLAQAVAGSRVQVSPIYMPCWPAGTLAAILLQLLPCLFCSQLLLIPRRGACRVVLRPCRRAGGRAGGIHLTLPLPQLLLRGALRKLGSPPVPALCDGQ